MTREKAEAIAKGFLRQNNPGMWDGTGEKPGSFITTIWEYELSEHNFLDISMEYSTHDKSWFHCCEIVDKRSDTMTEMLSGYGIDSYLNLADTIEDICQGF